MRYLWFFLILWIFALTINPVAVLAFSFILVVVAAILTTSGKGDGNQFYRD